MSSALYLVLDQGGSASRALVFDAAGHALASARIEVGDARPRPGWVEQDPDAVVQSLRDAADAALAQLDDAQRARLQACGLECQRSSLVCWDRGTGAALSPVLSWQDTRAADWLAMQDLDVEAIRATTGLYPNAHFGLSKLRWCLDHLDAVQDAAADDRLLFGPLAAFLAHRLLAQRPGLVDPANASRTLLFDLARGDWSDRLLQRFGIARRWLPVVAHSDAEFGDLELSSAAVEKLRGSRRSHMPLRLLSGDQSTAAFAYGELRADAAYLNVGTGAFAYRLADIVPGGSKLLRSVVHWSNAPQYVVEGTVNGAGSALAWFAQQQGIDDIAAALDAAWDDAAAGEVVFLNGIGGLGSPDWKPAFPSRFLGAGSTAQQLVAVAESIVFLVLRNLERLREVGAPCDYVVASGGVSRSDRFCQALADLAGLPVRRPTQCEASARGAAFLLAGRPADWAALPEHALLPRDNAALQERHRRWNEAMAAVLLT
jgi:glycerol kinase